MHGISARAARATRVALLAAAMVAACDSPTASPPSLDGSAPSGLASTAVASTMPNSSGVAPSTAAPGPALEVLALGDSIGRANACPGCIAFIDSYARAVAGATGKHVDVDNRAAAEESGLPPVEAAQLRNDILSDAGLRSAIASADVVVLTIGFNDTPWNRLDNPCGATSADGSVVRWEQITAACIDRVAAEYAETLDEIFTQIDELRGCFTPPGQPADFCALIGRRNTLLRLTTVYDDWNAPAAALAPTEATDRAFVAAQCWVVRQHGGQCADAFHALNGPQGSLDAGPFLANDHTHLNQRGHDAVAKLLAALGFGPFVTAP